MSVESTIQSKRMWRYAKILRVEAGPGAAATVSQETAKSERPVYQFGNAERCRPHFYDAKFDFPRNNLETGRRCLIGGPPARKKPRVGLSDASYRSEPRRTGIT
jgi:hypothetical protein